MTTQNPVFAHVKNTEIASCGDFPNHVLKFVLGQEMLAFKDVSVQMGKGQRSL